MLAESRANLTCRQRAGRVSISSLHRLRPNAVRQQSCDTNSIHGLRPQCWQSRISRPIRHGELEDLTCARCEGAPGVATGLHGVTMAAPGSPRGHHATGLQGVQGALERGSGVTMGLQGPPRGHSGAQGSPRGQGSPWGSRGALEELLSSHCCFRHSRWLSHCRWLPARSLAGRGRLQQHFLGGQSLRNPHGAWFTETFTGAYGSLTA